MSRFNYLSILCLLSLCVMTYPVLAQQKDLDHLEGSIKKLSTTIEKLGVSLADKIQQIDTREMAEDIEHIARLSEKHVQRLEENFGQEWDDHLSATSAEKTKTIQKVYIISRNTPLHIDNQYGKVEVNTWDKKEIRVDIAIRAMENSLSKAEDIINSVSIEEEKNSNQIRLSTHIARNRTNWWNNLSGGNKRGVQINYTIYMPKSNPLHVQNRYGSVILPDLEGDVTLDLGYGSLTAGNLQGNNTTVHSNYSSGSIASVQNAVLDFKYGKINLGQAKSIRLNLGYCGGSSIERLDQAGEVNVAYSGGLKIGLGKDITQFNLDAAYSSTVIHIDPQARFKFNVDVSYGGFDCGDCTITREDPAPDSRGPKLHRSYEGYFRGDSSNQVRVDAKYGSVAFRN